MCCQNPGEHLDKRKKITEVLDKGAGIGYTSN